MNKDMIPGTAIMVTGAPASAPSTTDAGGAGQASGDGGFAEALAGAEAVLDTAGGSNASERGAAQSSDTRDVHAGGSIDHASRGGADDEVEMSGGDAADAAGQQAELDPAIQAGSDESVAAASGAEAVASTVVQVVAVVPAQPVADAVDVALRVLTGDSLEVSASAAAASETAATQAAPAGESEATASALAAASTEAEATTGSGEQAASSQRRVVVAAEPAQPQPRVEDAEQAASSQRRVVVAAEPAQPQPRVVGAQAAGAAAVRSASEAAPQVQVVTGDGMAAQAEATQPLMAARSNDVQSLPLAGGARADEAQAVVVEQARPQEQGTGTSGREHGAAVAAAARVLAQATGQVAGTEEEASTSGTGAAGATGQPSTTPADQAGPDTVPATSTSQQAPAAARSAAGDAAAAPVAQEAASTQDADVLSDPSPKPQVQQVEREQRAPVTTQAAPVTSATAADAAGQQEQPSRGKAHRSGQGLAHASDRAREVSVGLGRQADVQQQDVQLAPQSVATQSQPGMAAAQQAGQAQVVSSDVKAELAPAANAAGGDAPAATSQAPAPAIQLREAARSMMGNPGPALAQERIDHIARQLATRMHLSQAAGGSEVQLHLRPRELGEVTVSLSVRQGVVTASVVADRSDTGRILQANLDELRRSLESQGLSVQQFSVDVRGGESRNPFAQLAQQQGQGGLHAGRHDGASTGAAGDGDIHVPGLSGDNVVAPEDHHDGTVSVLA